MKKRIFSFILAVLMILTFNVGAHAETAVQPRLSYGDEVSPGLTVSSSKYATSTVSIEGISGVTTRIEATMTLQKKGLFRWSDVTSWTFSTTNSSINYTKTYGPVDNGTYRVYVTCKLYSGSESETVPQTSATVKVS